MKLSKLYLLEHDLSDEELELLQQSQSNMDALRIAQHVRLRLDLGDDPEGITLSREAVDQAANEIGLPPPFSPQPAQEAPDDSLRGLFAQKPKPKSRAGGDGMTPEDRAESFAILLDEFPGDITPVGEAFGSHSLWSFQRGYSVYDLGPKADFIILGYSPETLKKRYLRNGNMTGGEGTYIIRKEAVQDDIPEIMKQREQLRISDNESYRIFAPKINQFCVDQEEKYQKDLDDTVTVRRAIKQDFRNLVTALHLGGLFKRDAAFTEIEATLSPTRPEDFMFDSHVGVVVEWCAKPGMTLSERLDYAMR